MKHEALHFTMSPFSDDLAGSGDALPSQLGPEEVVVSVTASGVASLGQGERGFFGRGGLCSLCGWFSRGRCGVGSRKREPGVIPGLPRSGEWERTPSSALGACHLGSDGQ